jgi:hypothetical protein
MIGAAILGFEEQKRHINSQIEELRAMLHGRGAGPAMTAVALKRKRRTTSAGARRPIAAAQSQRWAAVKYQAEPVTSETRKKKRRLSLAGRRAIIAATKKRWALIKAAKASETKERPGAKKTARKSAAMKIAA